MPTPPARGECPSISRMYPWRPVRLPANSSNCLRAAAERIGWLPRNCYFNLPCLAILVQAADSGVQPVHAGRCALRKAAGIPGLAAGRRSCLVGRVGGGLGLANALLRPAVHILYVVSVFRVDFIQLIELAPEGVHPVVDPLLARKGIHPAPEPFFRGAGGGGAAWLRRRAADQPRRAGYSADLPPPPPVAREWELRLQMPAKRGQAGEGTRVEMVRRLSSSGHPLRGLLRRGARSERSCLLTRRDSKANAKAGSSRAKSQIRFGLWDLAE